MRKQFGRTARGFAGVAALCLAGPALAQSPPRADDPVDAVARCRGERDDRARLACYDSATDRLVAARSNDEITVLTKAEVVEQRRAVFGLSVDDGRLFDRSAQKQRQKPPRIETLDSTVTRRTIAGRDTFTLTLADGGVWRTTESARVEPKVGDPVHIRRGAMGSYLGSFAGARSIRMERVR